MSGTEKTEKHDLFHNWQKTECLYSTRIIFFSMTATPIFLTLQSKKQPTHDIYELEYTSETPLPLLPWQFLLCDTAWDPKLRRSYSVSWAEWDRVFFIIKCLPEGKGGSMAICDQEIGHTMQVWWPLGHFTLRDTAFPKVFIGTGTGFAPLYFMLRSEIQNTKDKIQNNGLFFLFWVRELRDVFYIEELEEWSRSWAFDYEIFCSRESASLPEKHRPWRVTEYLTPENVSFMNITGETEFYICGSPAMVTEVRSILCLYGVSAEKAFFEQY
jgi:NAD(P)H-flavin reductase